MTRPAAMPRVSVIIPVYNNARTVAGCVRSVLANTYPDYEVVVVDDGSDDGTAEIVAELEGCRLLRLATNRGAAAARNQGVAHSDGSLLLFTDGDCLVTSDWIERWVEAHLRRTAETPRLVGGTGALAVFGNYWQRADVFALFGYNVSGPPRSMNGLITANSLLERRAFDEVGGFDEALRREEDRDLGLRLVRGGYELRYYPEISICHDHTRSSLARFVRYNFYLGRTVGLRNELGYAAERGLMLVSLYRSRWLYPLFILPLALAITLKILRANWHQNRNVVRYLPAVFLSKLCWRFGAWLWLLEQRGGWKPGATPARL